MGNVIFSFHGYTVTLAVRTSQ